MKSAVMTTWHLPREHKLKLASPGAAGSSGNGRCLRWQPSNMFRIKMFCPQRENFSKSRAEALLRFKTPASLLTGFLYWWSCPAFITVMITALSSHWNSGERLLSQPKTALCPTHNAPLLSLSLATLTMPLLAPRLTWDKVPGPAHCEYKVSFFFYPTYQ